VILMNYALISASGLVENVILLENPAEYDLPETFALVALEEDIDVGIGYAYANGVFTMPPQPDPPTPPTAAERLEAAGFSIAELRELLLGGQ
jgi:hypothetical protein